MAKNQKIYTAEDKLKIVEEFDRSGLNIAQFARKKDIPEPTIRAWVRSRNQGKDLRVRSKHGPRPIEERKQAIEAFQKSGLTQEEFSRTWGVSPSTLNAWLKQYKEHGMKGLEQSTFRRAAMKRGRKGISKELKREIIAVKRENPQFGLRKVKSFLNRFRGVDAALNTIRKTLREEKIETPPSRRRRRRSSERVRRFERARPMQLWQTDITYFTLTKHQQRCYLTVFLDDYSRYVVGWRLGLRQTGEFVMEALLDGIQRFGRPQEVLSDQGRQYFAWRGKTEFQNLLRKQGIKHVVARSHHPQTVGKCERLWKTINDEFWERVGPMDLEEAASRLQHFFNHYNHFRPNQGIDNLVPADRFFGAENEVRKAMEQALSENEIRLATGERPRAPTFLVGQIGGKAISMFGEQGKLVLQIPGEERREIQCETIETEGGENEGESNGREEREESEEGFEEEESEAATQVCPAGENSLGASEPGAEAKSTDNGGSDARVLDRPHHEGGSGEAAVCASLKDMAAVTASDIGYAGGITGAAQDTGERSADEPERRSESLEEENPGTRGACEEAGSPDSGAQIDAGVSGCFDTDGGGSGGCGKKGDSGESSQ